MNQNEFIQYVSNCTEVFYDEPEPEAALIFARALLTRAEAAEAEAARLRDENAEAWFAFYRQQSRGDRLAARVTELEAQLPRK